MNHRSKDVEQNASIFFWLGVVSICIGVGLGVRPAAGFLVFGGVTVILGLVVLRPSKD